MDDSGFRVWGLGFRAEYLYELYIGDYCRGYQGGYSEFRL